MSLKKEYLNNSLNIFSKLNSCHNIPIFNNNNNNKIKIYICLNNKSIIMILKNVIYTSIKINGKIYHKYPILEIINRYNKNKTFIYGNYAILENDMLWDECDLIGHHFDHIEAIKYWNDPIIKHQLMVNNMIKDSLY